MILWAQAAFGGTDVDPTLVKVERCPGRYHAGAQRGVDAAPTQEVVAPTPVPEVSEPAPSDARRVREHDGGDLGTLIATRFGDQVEAALAVAMCESKMDPSAVSYDGSSYGLFQIHAPTWAPVFAGFWEHWMEPKWNIEHAYIIWERSGWSAWSCW